MVDTRVDEGVGVSPEPDWFEKTEQEKIEHTYWTYSGTRLYPKRSIFGKVKNGGPTPISSRFLGVHHSKEEAEAYACIPSPNFVWDRKVAHPVALQTIMDEARSVGYAGVQCSGFKDGKWVILKTWLASQPLPSE